MTTDDAVPAKFQEPITPDRYNPAQDSWDDLARGADEILGHDLAKDEILDSLENVPFMITRVIFREADAGHRESYVTCECVIAPANILAKRRVNMQALPFDPGDHVVFNDGSTGIYRQVVAYLHAKGFIALPDPVRITGEGARWNEKESRMEYECSYDLPPDAWQNIHAGDLRFTENGRAIYVADVRLFAKRGIRISDGYSNDWTKDGKTRYLA